MVRAVHTGRSTGSVFDLASFSSLSSGSLCIFGLREFVVLYILLFALPFVELSQVGLALDLVDYPLSFTVMTLLVRSSGT